MSHEFFDIRTALTSELAFPRGPFLLPDPQSLQQLESAMNHSGPFLLVYPDGETVTRGDAVRLLLLRRRSVQPIRVRVVWVKGADDIDFYESFGLMLCKLAHPSVRQELLDMRRQPARYALKAVPARAWWLECQDDGHSAAAEQYGREEWALSVALARRRWEPA